MKRKGIFIFLLFIFTFSFSCVHALEACDMSDEYKRWLKLSEEERKNVSEPVYCASKYITKKEDKTKINLNITNPFIINTSEDGIVSANATDGKYDSREYGYVTSVKNQESTGSCWAFTSNANVEISAIKEGLDAYDLSEKHIEYSMTRSAFTDKNNELGFYRELDDGGNPNLSASYYFRYSGPIFESSFPGTNRNEKISYNDFPKDKPSLMIGNYLFETHSRGTCATTSTIAEIKQYLVNYGSVGINIYYSSSYLKNLKYFYYNGNAAVNHAVTIVGWDDSIPASNFKNNPPVNGAWIVKNSWGEEFGDKGYFYISYADYASCISVSAFSDISVNEYNYGYYSSEVISNFTFANNSTSVQYSSSKFTKKSSETEYLDRISTEVVKGNNYTIYVSLENNLKDQSNWKKVGSITNAGYSGIRSIKFNPIAINGDYTVIIKMTGSRYYIPAMCSLPNADASLYYQMPIDSGVNFYSLDGTNWRDMKSINGQSYDGCEPIIYAYTKLASNVNTTFSIKSITPSKSKVYTFTEDYFTVKTTSANVLSYELFGQYVYDSKGNNVTKDFKIDGSLQNGTIYIKLTDNVKAGKYTYRLKYNKTYKDITFDIYSILESNDYEVSRNYVTVKDGANKVLDKATFLSKVDSFGSEIKIYDKNDNDITGTVKNIGTGMKIKVNNSVYTVIYKGDVSGDGLIKGNDALLVSRQVVSAEELSASEKLAADTSGDGIIKGNDALIISRYVVGLDKSL